MLIQSSKPIGAQKIIRSILVHNVDDRQYEIVELESGRIVTICWKRNINRTK